MLILKILFVYAAIGVGLWFLAILALSIVMLPIFPHLNDQQEAREKLEFICHAPTYAKVGAFTEVTISIILFWPFFMYDLIFKKEDK